MDLKLFKKYNVLNLSGISQFLLIELKRKEVRLILVNVKFPLKLSHIHEPKITPVKASTYDIHANDKLTGIIENFIKEFNSTEIYAIWSIDEFQLKNISIPNDDEDIDLWILENQSKLLPEGKKLEEFCYTYEIIDVDENYSYLYVLLARNNQISEINNVKIPLVKTAVIFPFELSVLKNKEEEGAVVIDITAEIVKIFLLNKKQVLIEEYYNTFSDFNSDESASLLNTISQLIKTTNVDKTKLLLNCSKQVYRPFLQHLGRYIEFVEIPPYDINLSEYTAALLSLKKLLNEFDVHPSLQPETIANTVREEIEKKTILRLTLTTGSLLLGLLIVLFIIQSFFVNRSEEESQSESQITSSGVIINNLKKENSQINSNLIALSGLKIKDTRLSQLLNKLTYLVNNNSYLTAVNIKKNTSAKSIVIEITGISKSQEDIASIVSNYEHSSGFSDTKLLYSGPADEENLSGMKKFNILTKYDY